MLLHVFSHTSQGRWRRIFFQISTLAKKSNFPSCTERCQMPFNDWPEEKYWLFLPHWQYQASRGKYLGMRENKSQCFPCGQPLKQSYFLDDFSLFSMCMTCSLQGYSSSCCCFLRELVSFVHPGDYLNFDMWHILHQWEKIWVGNVEHVTIIQVKVYMYVVKHSTLLLLHSMKHFI